jgi:hypothetical protein
MCAPIIWSLSHANSGVAAAKDHHVKLFFHHEATLAAFDGLVRVSMALRRAIVISPRSSM